MLIEAITYKNTKIELHSTRTTSKEKVIIFTTQGNPYKLMSCFTILCDECPLYASGVSCDETPIIFNLFPNVFKKHPEYFI